MHEKDMLDDIMDWKRKVLFLEEMRKRVEDWADTDLHGHQIRICVDDALRDYNLLLREWRYRLAVLRGE